MRVVTASGWPYEYRAHVEQHDGWFRKGWKYVIEQKWVHWERYTSSFKVFKTREEAEAAANRWLDANDRDFVERDFV